MDVGLNGLESSEGLRFACGGDTCFGAKGFSAEVTLSRGTGTGALKGLLTVGEICARTSPLGGEFFGENGFRSSAATFPWSSGKLPACVISSLNALCRRSVISSFFS